MKQSIKLSGSLLAAFLFVQALSAQITPPTTPPTTPIPPTPAPSTQPPPMTPRDPNVATPAPNVTPLSATDLNTQVTKFNSSWQDAYNRADNAALQSMYSNDVMRINPDGTTTRMTAEAYLSEFTANKGQTELLFGNAVVQPDGKVRVIGTYKNSFIDDKTGKTRMESGTYDNLLIQENGNWKLTQTKMLPDKPAVKQ